MKMNVVRKLMIVAFMLTSFWSFGQSIDQVIGDLDAERYTAALDGANKLVITSPNEDTYFLKGYTILKSPEYNKPENLKEAEEAFQAGIDLGGKKGSNLNSVGLGMVKLASKDMAGAKAIFEQVKKNTKSKDPEILYRIAEAYTMFHGATDPAEAVMLIDQALSKLKVKTDPELYYVKADAYMLKNDGGSAMTALQYAEELPSKKAKTYAKMAQLWLQSRNYKDALDNIEKGKAADPHFAPIYKFESSYYQSFSNFPKSAEAASNYLKNSDGDVRAKLRYAKLAFLAKDYKNMKRVLGEVKGLTKDEYIHRMEGIVNYNEKNYRDAIKNFREFIKNEPNDENPGMDYGYIGRSYLQIEEPDEDKQAENDSLGILNIEKAVSLKDSSMNYFEEAANIFNGRGKYEKAARMMERDLKHKKEPHAGDYATVATNYFRARNWKKADEFFDEALSRYEDQWPTGYALSGFAKTYRYTNDSVMNATYPGAPQFEKYLDLLGEAGMKEPANRNYVVAALKTLAGRDLLLRQDPKAALLRIEKVLELNPDDAEAQAMMHRFKKMIDPNYVIPTEPGGGK